MKVSKHIPSDFSVSTTSSFRSIESKHEVYKDKDCMNKFCESLRQHAIKISSFKTKKSEIIN